MNTVLKKRKKKVLENILFQNNEDIRGCVNDFVELNDIGVVDFFQNFDFTLKTFHGTWCQYGFVDNFDRITETSSLVSRQGHCAESTSSNFFLHCISIRNVICSLAGNKISAFDWCDRRKIRGGGRRRRFSFADFAAVSFFFCNKSISRSVESLESCLPRSLDRELFGEDEPMVLDAGSK